MRPILVGKSLYASCGSCACWQGSLDDGRAGLPAISNGEITEFKIVWPLIWSLKKPRITWRERDKPCCTILKWSGVPSSDAGGALAENPEWPESYRSPTESMLHHSPPFPTIPFGEAIKTCAAAAIVGPLYFVTTLQSSLNPHLHSILLKYHRVRVLLPHESQLS